jgi:hypothetical protein
VLIFDTRCASRGVTALAAKLEIFGRVLQTFYYPAGAFPLHHIYDKFAEGLYAVTFKGASFAVLHCAAFAKGRSMGEIIRLAVNASPYSWLIVITITTDHGLTHTFNILG